MRARSKILNSLPSGARPTWAEISLSQILKNFQAIQRRVGKACEVLAVVKANAYGHGAVPVSRYLASQGARWFGVATLEEALALRRAGIRDQILWLGAFFPEQAKVAVENGIHVTVSSWIHLDALDHAASVKRPAGVHLKFDSGMGRLGFSWDEAEWLSRRWAKGAWPRVRLMGISSHLASAEDPASRQTPAQTARFLGVLDAFDAECVEVPVRHLANSAGLSFHPATRLTLVRAGIALYGYEPRLPEIKSMGTAPALSLKTRIVHLKTVRRGTPLGYDATFVTRRPSVIATLPIGYADGVNRRLSFSNLKKGQETPARPTPMQTIIRGQRAPIVGRISMDLTLVDVTQLDNVRVNEEVILLGRTRTCSVTAEDWAKYVGTISYEVLCALSSRVYRVYRE